MIVSGVKRGFTLLEMLITMVIFFGMITIVTTIFIYIYKSKGALEARQVVTKESYFFLEKLQVMTKGYTIDYEEYRNRSQVGCMSPNNPTRSATGHCTMMTYYGNNNILSTDHTDENAYYYCSSSTSETTPLKVYYFLGSTCENVARTSLNTTTSGFIQSYGQYEKLFIDVKADVDYNPGAVKDDDDLDLGNGPMAIGSGTIPPQELYLISQDKTQRILLRRKLIEQSDYNSDGAISESEKLYTIQVLQLKGLDAGISHSFNTDNPGVYDGIIDTRACDYSLGFQCHGASVGGAYADFKLPLTGDDGRQNLLTNDITIPNRNLVISPLIDPTLAWAVDDAQINPFFSIDFTTKLYGKNWFLKIPWNQMDTYNIKLQSTFSTLPSFAK